MRILGVDPGSQYTGYGCIEWNKAQPQLVAHGTLCVQKKGGMFEKLHHMAQQLSQVLVQYHPQVVVIERVFFSKNPVSALVLSQIRGAFIFIAKEYPCQVAEYTATEVKSAIVGHGQAEKMQVQKFLACQLKIPFFSSMDASDGLALAVCHGLHHNRGGCKSDNKGSLGDAVSHRFLLSGR